MTFSCISLDYNKQNIAFSVQTTMRTDIDNKRSADKLFHGDKWYENWLHYKGATLTLPSSALSLSLPLMPLFTGSMYQPLRKLVHILLCNA